MTVQAESSFPSYTGSSHRQHPGCSTSCTWASARWPMSRSSACSVPRYSAACAPDATVGVSDGPWLLWSSLSHTQTLTNGINLSCCFRHATLRDLVIDTLGALLAQALVWWYATRKWPFTPPTQVRAGAKKPK